MRTCLILRPEVAHPTPLPPLPQAQRSSSTRGSHTHAYEAIAVILSVIFYNILSCKTFTNLFSRWIRRCHCICARWRGYEVPPPNKTCSGAENLKRASNHPTPCIKVPSSSFQYALISPYITLVSLFEENECADCTAYKEKRPCALSDRCWPCRLLTLMVVIAATSTAMRHSLPFPLASF